MVYENILRWHVNCLYMVMKKIIYAQDRLREVLLQCLNLC